MQWNSSIYWQSPLVIRGIREVEQPCVETEQCMAVQYKGNTLTAMHTRNQKLVEGELLHNDVQAV